MKIIVTILSISTLYSSYLFKGYIKSNQYYSFYAEGHYENGLMSGEWNYYTDSTKVYKVASGNYIKGNKSRISKTGIPEHGREGMWKHYYNTRYGNHIMKNQLKAIQQWSNGKLHGNFKSFFKDGKIAVESNYKYGKQDGERREWYKHGFMYTKPYRVTEFNEGKPYKDIIYNLDTNLFIISSYSDSTRIDSIYEFQNHSLAIISEVKNKLLHGTHKLFHKNGQIWKEGNFVEGYPHGLWNEYSETGILMTSMKFENGNAVIQYNENQIIRDIKGNILYSYKYIDGKRNGDSIELLYNVPKIGYYFEFDKSIHRNLNNYVNSYSYNILYTLTDRKYENQSLYNMRHNYGFRNYNISMNKYLDEQYTIKWNDFKGIYLHQPYSRLPKNKILGKGKYKNNIRIGSWTWEELDTGRTILIGQYNETGVPIGIWEETDVKDKNNIIITKFKNGKIISKSKKTITTFSSK